MQSTQESLVMIRTGIQPVPAKERPSEETRPPGDDGFANFSAMVGVPTWTEQDVRDKHELARLNEFFNLRPRSSTSESR